MSSKYKNIILCGFRATGKSTIGALVARSLGWKFVEMDRLIVERAGCSVSELTQNGTHWQNFREIESSMLQTVMNTEYTVISAGGGVGVNNHINVKSNKTFGEEQRTELKKAYFSLITVLTAPVAVLKQRIIQDEMKKQIIHRPILDQEKAKELEVQLQKEQDPEKQKQITIEYIVEDAIKMYLVRQSLYSELSSFSIDTGSQIPDVIARQIGEKIKHSVNTL